MAQQPSGLARISITQSVKEASKPESKMQTITKSWGLLNLCSCNECESACMPPICVHTTDGG